MKYSFVIPVYNRPDEVEELLESMTQLTMTDFEVVIVEDGSSVPCEEVCRRYADRLNLKYFSKDNSGPGQSRNYGVERAEGEYVLILDSDVVLPPGYLDAVDEELRREPADAFGGPDRAHSSFSDTQKAISYSMTSFFTTGGIRGGKKKLDKFYPRSFNMGLRREVYQQLGGFSQMRFGEDIDFSIRIFKAGCRCRLFPGAWVYHKRRTDFRKFWRQVYNSGIARINLYKRYPESLKLVHLLPMVFTLGVVLCWCLIFAGGVAIGSAIDSHWWGQFLDTAERERAFTSVGAILIYVGAAPLLFYDLVVLVDSALQYRSLKIGFLSIHAAYVQLTGYGCGFLEAWWKRCVQGKDEFAAYMQNFYK